MITQQYKKKVPCNSKKSCYMFVFNPVSCKRSDFVFVFNYTLCISVKTLY
jgi:hypothetical protein